VVAVPVLAAEGFARQVSEVVLLALRAVARPIAGLPIVEGIIAEETGPRVRAAAVGAAAYGAYGYNNGYYAGTACVRVLGNGRYVCR
jgi:hypothetical protein